jgi:hypothetical protein
MAPHLQELEHDARCCPVIVPHRHQDKGGKDLGWTVAAQALKPTLQVGCTAGHGLEPRHQP